MAKRRGLSEIEYAKIWRRALGRFRDENQAVEKRYTLREVKDYRLLMGSLC